MGLPVLLSVLAEDRDDLELLKGALEVLQLSVALPEGFDIQQQQLEQQQGVSPHAEMCQSSSSSGRQLSRLLLWAVNASCGAQSCTCKLKQSCTCKL